MLRAIGSVTPARFWRLPEFIRSSGIFRCSLAYLIILDHPYVGVSDEDGDLLIKNLPEENLTFRVWVEAAAGVLSSVKVNGNGQHWPRNRFEYRIKAGENDMGTVTLTADQLGR